MIVTQAKLEALRVGFSKAFGDGLAGMLAASQYTKVATTIASSTGETRYGFLNKMPGLREWLGDRVVHGLAESEYSIRNKDWELTVGVDRNDIEDDNLGIYQPMFTHMGEAAATKPDTMIFALLKAGFATACSDGQYFFDTDHPVPDADGVIQSVSNTGGGSGTPWFLLDTRRFLKPLIYQERKKPHFDRLDRSDDANVFMRRQYLYGVDCRSNAGFGFWQMAYGSKQTLDAAAYAAGRAAMQNFSEQGRPLGIVPNLLVVPPSLESAGRKILNSELGSGGETNEWKGTAELLVCPWLA
jgi:phage major head subunit gpT-like protein